MDRIGRFVGELITIDGKVGVVCGTKESKYWSRAPSPNSEEVLNPDCHYRFAWKEGNTIYSKIISGRGLIPAEDYVAHTDKSIGKIRKMSFVSRERNSGLVGKIIAYEIKPAVIKKTITNAQGEQWEEIKEIYLEQDTDYQTMKFYEGQINSTKNE